MSIIGVKGGNEFGGWVNAAILGGLKLELERNLIEVAQNVREAKIQNSQT
jgi:hypothetical protein